MNNKELKIEVPKGFEIDKANSTFERIVFKEIQKEITERIKTFQDVLDYLGNLDEDVVDYKLLINSNVSKFILASLQIKMIVKVLNEGWIPNWKNISEYKWYPWVYLNEDNKLSLNPCDYYFSNSVCSTHFCFKSEELCRYAFNQFNEIYYNYFKINS